MEILRLWISSGDRSPVSYCPFCSLPRKSGQRIQATSFPFQTTEVMESKKWIPAQEISTKRRKAQSPKASRDGSHLLEGASQCVCQSIHCVGKLILLEALELKQRWEGTVASGWCWLPSYTQLLALLHVRAPKRALRGPKLLCTSPFAMSNKSLFCALHWQFNWLIEDRRPSIACLGTCYGPEFENIATYLCVSLLRLMVMPSKW